MYSDSQVNDLKKNSGFNMELLPNAIQEEDDNIVFTHHIDDDDDFMGETKQKEPENEKMSTVIDGIDFDDI